MRKGSAPKSGEDAEEAVTPAFLASLAAKIAPGLCLNAPRQAIEAAARLIECAREWLAMPGADDEKASLAEEKVQLKAEAKHADEYAFKLTGRNLSLADAFALQKADRFWKGKRREGPYKTEASFAAALRGEKLTWQGFDGVEETTEKAVKVLFERMRERRLEKDNARKKRVK